MTEFIGCPWCHIRTQGCRCASPCGVEHCGEVIDKTFPAEVANG